MPPLLPITITLIFFISLPSPISSLHSPHSPPPLVAFWNIYWNQKINFEILNEQFTVLNSSGLFDRLDALYLSTIGTPYHNLTEIYHHSKIHHQYHENVGLEGHTLTHLYEYCHRHPRSKVLYFHNKGSYTLKSQNTQLRRSLNCYVLTPSCISILDHYDTCGMRVSPVPKFHYPGNFWWAKCNYINRLIHPLSYPRNETLKNLTDSLLSESKVTPPCIGAHRFFAEHWLLSSPLVNPADCFPGNYLCGYALQEKELLEVCVNFNSSRYMMELEMWKLNSSYHPNFPGTTCGRPRALQDRSLYSPLVMSMIRKNCSSLRSVWKRTQYWYGQPPTSFIDWIELISNRSIVINEDELNSR